MFEIAFGIIIAVIVLMNLDTVFVLLGWLISAALVIALIVVCIGLVAALA